MPYADIIRALAMGQDNQEVAEAFHHSRILFPFLRTRVRNYTKISVVLNGLIKEAMRLSEDEMNSQEARIGLSADALRRIDSIHQNSCRGGEEQR